MTAPDVAEIARGLTKAQRELILELTGGWQFSRGKFNSTNASNLCTRYNGQLGERTISPCYGGGNYAFRLNDLGLAVRTYLQENPDA